MTTLFEYQCDCGNNFMARKRIEDRATAICPKCKRTAGKKISVVYSSFGFRLTDKSENVRFSRDTVERDV